MRRIPVKMGKTIEIREINKTKIIVKLDVNEDEREEIMNLVRNFNYKILDEEKYMEEIKTTKEGTLA